MRNLPAIIPLKSNATRFNATHGSIEVLKLEFQKFILKRKIAKHFVRL